MAVPRAVRIHRLPRDGRGARPRAGARQLTAAPGRRTALVTGAGGFIGARLVERLQALGHAVVGVGRPGAEPWRLPGDVETVEVDLRDPGAVGSLIARVRPEWVFHLAAHGAYSWQREVVPIFETNVMATVHLVEAALEHGCRAFVHAGSSSEYGFKDHAPAESEAVEPNSHYAVAKAAATSYCAYTSRARDAHLVTLRLYSIYGPWEDPGRLMPRLVLFGRRGALPPLADPETARDFVHVDDAVDAFLAVAERQDLPRGSVFNVGSGRQTTLRDLVEVVRDEFGVAAEPSWGSGHVRGWDTSVWVADPRAIRDALGWRAGVGLREGLRATADWIEGDPALLKRYERANELR